MPRTAITATAPTVAGVAETAEVDGDAVNGNSVSNARGNTVVVVRNADAGGAHSVTFVTSATFQGFAVADSVVSIPASSSRSFSGFDPRVFGRTLEITVDSTQLKLKALIPPS